MTQLDVPNISFIHYLDLLKRRTWHVVTVSVLGLVVGGVVAMLIPRYYVATTTIELSRPILDPARGTPKDLMSQSVNAAKVTVPKGVEKAVRELGWIEAVSGSMNDRRAFIQAIKGRVNVYDHGPHNPGRIIAHVMISYRDLRGDRAAAMANSLRKIWLKEFITGLKDDAQREIDEVIQRKESVRKEKGRVARALQVFEQENNINPADWNGNRADSGLISTISRSILTLRRDIGAGRSELNRLDRLRGARSAERDGLSPTLTMSVEDMFTNPAMRVEYGRLVGVVTYARIKLDNLKPAHELYNSTERTLRKSLSRLAELQKLAGGQASEKPNPQYTALGREIRNLEVDKNIQADKVRELEAQLEQLQDQAAKLPGINLEYRALREKFDNLRAQERSRLADLESKTRTMVQIQTQRPYVVLAQAFIPPAPTEPQAWMLAMMGCIVGLAVAIALVLLIDFLQMSFKSVADVESGLGLPVLGTMTYLETDEEVLSTRGRRKRLTVFAVTFLVLFLTVVTIYYVDRTALPEMVNKFFDQILGDPR